MFLVQPRVSFYTVGLDLFAFGDPFKLKYGVHLKEKKTGKDKVIFSLYDLEIGMKYLLEKGDTVQRTSEREILVKRKTKNRDNGTKSDPINIPEPAASVPIPISKPTRRHSRGSYPSSGDGVSDTESSFGSPFQCVSASPRSFEELSPAFPARRKFEAQEAVKVVVEIQTENIPGERMELKYENVTLVRHNKPVNGTLFVTNYQIMFIPNEREETLEENSPFFGEESGSNSSFKKEKSLFLPLTAIAKFDKVDRQKTNFMFGERDSYIVDITTKDIRRTIRLALIPKFHSRKVLCDFISRFISPKSTADIFAMSCESYRRKEGEIDGWSLYNSTSEYSRIGVGIGELGAQWRITEVNEGYALCDSYPKQLVVPSQVSDRELMEEAQFRSKGRIPILSWRNPLTGASLTRCSQPKTGISRTFRCKADEKMISSIQAANPCNSKLYIIDARPVANALANMALGGGYENISFYPDCELEWLNIGNIHVVRDSWNKLKDLCDVFTLPPAEGEQNASNKSNNSWLSQLEATHWLDHQNSLLIGATRIVEVIDAKKASVLLHCSDGWDRTTQVISLAELLLDGYYRTTVGFCVLIEKEWLSFGHKFAERLGLNFEDSTKDGERSPIFLQFLDATWQVMMQFPTAFEFNEELLLLILFHSHSGRFGTFLMNSQRDREHRKLSDCSASLWTLVMSQKAQFDNPFYSPTFGALRPSADIKDLQLWKSYYMQYLLEDEELYKNPFSKAGKQMKNQLQVMQEQLEKLMRENEELKRSKEKEEKVEEEKPIPKRSSEVDFSDWIDLDKTQHRNSPLPKARFLKEPQ